MIEMVKKRMSRVCMVFAGILFGATGVACSQTMPVTPELEKKYKSSSVFDLEAIDIDGKPVKFSDYHGKVLLIVNVASKCGFTPQYEGLEKLQKEYGSKGLVVLGFPSNDFGGQEPGSPEEIKQFCSSKYNVTFPMFAKVVTKPGEKQSPIYQCLGTKTGKLPGWNFCKYVVGRDGKTVTFFDSRATPTGSKVQTAVDKAIAQPAPSSGEAK